MKSLDELHRALHADMTDLQRDELVKQLHGIELEITACLYDITTHHFRLSNITPPVSEHISIIVRHASEQHRTALLTYSNWDQARVVARFAKATVGYDLPYEFD